LVEIEVFGREGIDELNETTMNIKVGELLNEQCQVKEKREIVRLINRELNWAEYFRLREVITRIKQEYGIISMRNVNQLDLEDFVMRQKKGVRDTEMCYKERRVRYILIATLEIY
jgi:hypothetical protein